MIGQYGIMKKAVNTNLLNMSNNNEVTTGEIMEFLRENMVTKEELKENLARELRKMQQEILDGVDEKLFNLKGLLPNMLPAAIA